MSIAPAARSSRIARGVPGRDEAGELLDAQRQAGEALAHDLEVLAHQERGRGEDRHLPARARDDECGAQRHLRLAEPDVAADQPIHRPAGAQIVEDRLDRGVLVVGLLVGKARRELLVQAGRRLQMRALAERAPRRDVDQLAGDLADPLFHLGLAHLPAEAAELVERCRSLGRAVARQKVEVLDRHEQLVAALVDQSQAVVRRAAHLERDEAVVAADAVIVVDDEVALGERCDLGDELVGAAPAARRARQPVAEDVGLGEHAMARRDEAVVERQHRERGLGALVDIGPGVEPAQCGDAMVGQHHAQALERALARRGDHDAPTGGALGADVLRHHVEQVDILTSALGSETARGLRRKVDHLDADLRRCRRCREGREIVALALLAEPRDLALAQVQLVRRQRPVGGGAHGACGLGRVPARLVVVADQVEPRRDHVVGLRVEADRAGGVEPSVQPDEPLVKQRQPVLHARERPAGADRFEQRITGCGAEVLQIADPEARDRRLVQQHLADRSQLESRHLGERALRQRIEATDRLEHVAEQVEAQRLRAAARVDVDDPSADRILAGLDHGAAAAIAVTGEAEQQLLAIDALAGGGREQARAHHLRRRQLLQQRVDGGEDQARRPAPPALLEQPGQRVEALGHDVLVRRDPIVGQAVPGRQHDHLEPGREEADELGQMAGARAIAGDVQELAGRLRPGELGQEQGVAALDRGCDQVSGRLRLEGRRGFGMNGRFRHRNGLGKQNGRARLRERSSVPRELEAAQQVENIVIVPGRRQAAPEDPGQKVRVALIEQRLVAIQLARIEPHEVLIGKSAEQQIALEAAPITTPVEQTLATDGDRLAHRARCSGGDAR